MLSMFNAIWFSCEQRNFNIYTFLSRTHTYGSRFHENSTLSTLWTLLIFTLRACIFYRFHSIVLISWNMMGMWNMSMVLVCFSSSFRQLYIALAFAVFSVDVCLLSIVCPLVCALLFTISAASHFMLLSCKPMNETRRRNKSENDLTNWWCEMKWTRDKERETHRK